MLTFGWLAIIVAGVALTGTTYLVGREPPQPQWLLPRGGGVREGREVAAGISYLLISISSGLNGYFILRYGIEFQLRWLLTLFPGFILNGWAVRNPYFEHRGVWRGLARAIWTGGQPWPQDESDDMPDGEDATWG